MALKYITEKKDMNERKRFIETLLFNEPDRIPLQPGGGRKSTRQRWHKEGLPKHIDTGPEITAEAYRQAGGTLELAKYGDTFGVVLNGFAVDFPV